MMVTIVLTMMVGRVQRDATFRWSLCGRFVFSFFLLVSVPLSALFVSCIILFVFRLRVFFCFNGIYRLPGVFLCFG